MALLAWLHDLLNTTLLNSVRLFAAFTFIPFLNEKFILSRTTRGIVIFLLAQSLTGDYAAIAPSFSVIHLLSEITVGLVMGLVYSTPFFILSALGEYIDNQRGANISDIADPTTGSDASPFSTYLNLFGVSFFLMNDGMLLLLSSLRESYILLPPGQLLISINYSVVMAWLTESLSLSLLFCMPVFIILFICEVSLGALALYNSQLNPFSLSLSVKSIIAFLLALLLFRGTTVWDAIALFDPAPLVLFLRGRDG